MSNVLKGFFVSVEDDKRVVDTNELVQIRIQEEQEKRARLQAIADEGYDLEEGFQEGLPISNLDALVSDDSESMVIKGNAEPMMPDTGALDELNAQIEEANEVLESLRAEADSIMESAQIEAENIKAQAFESAKAEGYQAGYDEGMQAVSAFQAELEDQANQMNAQYQQALEELEPAFIEAITDIYEHIFKVDLESYKGVVANLLIDTINGNSDAKNIIIHLSREDYPMIIEMKEDILTETGMMADNVEFIQDATLGSSDCIIETDNGIFDCSLGTELKELKKKLTLLSYRK